jgi:cyclic pyranopterin phosphate synthase
MINESNDITDSDGRSFKTLRVSLTSSCNLACLYCVDEDVKGGSDGQNKNEPLRLDEYLNIIRGIHERVGLETVRLTGGEPLLYKNITALISGIRELGINRIKITTNGTLLESHAAGLALAGLSSANVSLDGANLQSFRNMTRRKNISKVIDGIDAAVKSGIDVKINSVMMKHINHDQVLPLLGFARERNIIVRYLELMKMGHLHDKHNSFFYSEEEILNQISGEHSIKILERKKGATARYWMTEEGQTFGIIANESVPFCKDCNRLRLDSYGNIYGCLSSSLGIKISHIMGKKEELDSRLRMALAQKQKEKFKGSETSMQYIGG